MVASAFFQRFVALLFTLVNGSLLYLFLLHLPYSMEALLVTFVHWNELSPPPAIMMALSVAVMVIALVARSRLSDEWKNRLIYFRMRLAHPAHRAFFGGKDPGIDLALLRDACPEVHDSAYDPRVQYSAWHKLLRKHGTKHVVGNADAVRRLLGDVYILSLTFLAAFLVAWPLNSGTVFQIAAPYLFIFGAQALFLLLSARGAGHRLVVNVLALEAGFGSDKPLGKTRKP